MSSERRTYSIDPIIVNGITVVQVMIDPHYESKHRSYMSDDLILKLVEKLDGRRELPDSFADRYSYFATLIEHGDRKYRLIWLLEAGAI